jgi:hypothetical protein
MKPEFLEELRKTAARQSPMEDDPEFNAYDYCGGNYDDAWYGGVSDGETQLAREVLEELGVEWKTDNQPAKS